MKTLYIDINGDSIISPSEEIEVYSYNLIDDYFYFVGEKIAGRCADKIDLIPLLTDYEVESGSTPFTEQWKSLKAILFGKEPQGIYVLTLPKEYLTWLKFSADTVYRNIYNDYYKDMQSASIDIDLKDLYDDSVALMIGEVCRYLDRNADKGFTHLGFEDGLADESNVCSQILKATNKHRFPVMQYYDKDDRMFHKKKVDIDLGNCTLSMVHIPGDGNIEGFYVSELPITIEQYKALYTKDTHDSHAWIKYYEKYGAREYEGFTLASAYKVGHVIDFMNNIKQPIFYRLPYRKQWLHLVKNYYERVKWCTDSKFLGIGHKAIAWEMMRDNSYDIYCLLGVVYNTQGERMIKGNNFRSGQERDNIAFRLVCSETDINNI